MSRKSRDVPWLGRESGRPNWFIYWYDAGAGKVSRRSTGTGDDREAHAQLGRFITARAETPPAESKPEPERRRVALRADECRVENVLEWYLTDRVPALSGAGPATAGYNCKAILSHLVGVRVSDLTPAVLSAYQRDRGVKIGTVRREMAVLAAAIKDATESGRLVGAPTIKLPPAPPGRQRHLSAVEVGKLLAECHEDHLRLFVLLALNTGARRAAILDLTWPQVDFVHGVIDLNPPDRAQTQKRRPKVPMSAELADALRIAQETADSLYVVSWRGQPVADVKTGLGHAAQRAGIAGVSAHVLRHTAGTMLAKAGVPLWTIAGLLGHSVTKTTELYAHFSPEFGRDAVKILGRVTG